MAGNDDTVSFRNDAGIGFGDGVGVGVCVRAAD
jgi:hypothetical protein